MRYVGGIDEQGQAIEVSDPLLNQIQTLVGESPQGELRVKALLSLEVVFGKDLPINQTIR
ncbi:D-mannonate oxidoreductase [Budvicia aquatica]|uniref:D-mannonate oxidoreductase n=1 Tax=Budvicia aquatica TaxID=82979 RepID=A0A484ZCC9_9GAMM|nr:D-mannonate oxidoreductase [Budvicia aquatica]